MTPFLGAFASHSTFFGTWAVIGLIESCIPQWSDPIIHCEQSVRFYVIFTFGVLVLSGVLAWVTTVIYYPVVPFPTTVSELPSTLLFNCVLGVVSYGLIRWTLYSPSIARPFFDWLGASLLIGGMLLVLINHLSRKSGES